MVTQSYHLVDYDDGDLTTTSDDTPLAEWPPAATAETALTNLSVYWAEALAVAHTTILLPSPTQYLDLKFRRDSLLTLSFTVNVKANWLIGTYQVPVTGSTDIPKARHTPDVTYEMSTVMTSQHLKLVLTELDPATNLPFKDPEEIFRFTVVQKATLPEETPNEEQLFYLTTAQF